MKGNDLNRKEEVIEQLMNEACKRNNKCQMAEALSYQEVSDSQIASTFKLKAEVDRMD